MIVAGGGASLRGVCPRPFTTKPSCSSASFTRVNYLRPLGEQRLASAVALGGWGACLVGQGERGAIPCPGAATGPSARRPSRGWRRGRARERRGPESTGRQEGGQPMRSAWLGAGV